MNNRETVGPVTRYWQSGRREREGPAPARDRPVPRTHRRGRRPASALFLPQQRRPRVYAYFYAIQTGNNKGPGWPGPLMSARNNRLFQRGVDRVEGGAEFAADAVDRSDDHERNAGGNQAVFDGGGARLI